MIYLDYSATTPVNDEVLDTFCKVSKNFVGNPNSLHKLGVEAKELIDASTSQIEDILKLHDKEVIYTKILDNILATTTKNTSKITFFYGQGKHPEKFTILKDFNDNDIYFSEDTKPDKNFVTKYYDDIIYIFDTLEVFAKLTKSDIGISKENYNLKPMVFSDGFLTLTIAFDTLGKVTTNISINKTEDASQIYKRNWYTRKSLSEIVSENNDEILRKIPININNIDPKYQAIINEYTKYN